MDVWMDLGAKQNKINEGIVVRETDTVLVREGWFRDKSVP